MDEFDLNRFVAAQEGTYEQALSELRKGRKTSHWMWFIFPQLHGLGSSAAAQLYAIASIEEARHFLSHPLLGPRLKQSVAALQDLVGMTAEEVFGPIDAKKLQSCLTLFSEAAPREAIFAAALDRWFRGMKDERTLERLACTSALPRQDNVAE
jgi:uncharacterized protein (DUF1810 family)